MADVMTKRFSLAGLARVTHATFDWRKWTPRAKRFERSDQPSAEVLDQLIEAEIIPRLMLANRQDDERAVTASVVTPLRPFSADEVDSFARLTITSDPDTVIAEVDSRMAAGASHDDILLRLLAPAARRLGVLWEEDDVDFTEVTIGLMKLHRVVQRLNHGASPDMGVSETAPRILLAPALGEQHLLGVIMVGEFFARSGWGVRCEPHRVEEHIISCVAEEHFDVVGLSASTQDAAAALSEEIRAIRAASLNPNVIVMVGGPIFNEDLDLAQKVGADATAVDGLRAVVTAERLVHPLTSAVGTAQ